MKRVLALLVAAACLRSEAWAQHADENAARSADDAFGITIGNDKIGLYSDSDARGFSPLTAGNVRIEGLYSDSRLPYKVLENSTIRVGMAAQSYPFPAPTGIVDYTLRTIRGKNRFSSVLQAGPNNGFAITLDGERRIIPGKLGIYAALHHQRLDLVPGNPFDGVVAAMVSRWRPFDGAEVTAFYAYGAVGQNKFNPLIFTAGPFVPPDAKAKFFGQDWSRITSFNRNYGVFARAPLGEDWTLRSGLFRHGGNSQGAIADLYLNTGQDGLPAQHVVTNQRPMDQPSLAGETRLTGVFNGKDLRHTLHFSVRGRVAERNFGGTALASVAPIPLGQRIDLPEPSWVYGSSSLDEVRQWAGGVQYQLARRNLGEISIGVQQVDYEKTVTPTSGAPPTITTDDPLFVNGSATLRLTQRLSFYAGYAQGLEEVPLAPENAANANEALPAIHTAQNDFGFRYALTPKLALVLGYFDIEKPYFNLDSAGVFRTLGDERHRGVEFSLAGAVTDRLSIVAGAVVQRPRVTGAGVDSGLIGPLPVSQPEALVRLNLDYRTPWVDGLSLDAALLYTGERAATTRQFAALGGKQLNAEAFAIVDLGMRYRFAIAGHAASLRAQVLNAFDDFTWRIYPSGAFYAPEPRNFQITLTTDF